MIDFISGATAMGSFVAAAYFVRFYRDTRDRLFALFGVAFAIFGTNRIILSLLEDGHEADTYVYLSRLCAFVLIIIAVIDKNRPGGTSPRTGPH